MTTPAGSRGGAAGRPPIPGQGAALAIVPARLESARMARKMLRRETGRYLFEHTVRNTESSGVFERVVLATDSERILEAARGVDVEAVLTSPEHRSGTDRVHEALGRLPGGGAFGVVVNVQGDEPDLPAADLRELVGAFADPSVEIATLAVPIERERESLDPSVVKVVLDRDGFALYFSRAPIPAAPPEGRPGEFARPADPASGCALRHIGVYAFRPAALARVSALPPGRLERAERLEQLRWLEAGERIRVLQASRVPSGIDTEEDYRAFVDRIGRAASSPAPGASSGTAPGPPPEAQSGTG